MAKSIRSKVKKLNRSIMRRTVGKVFNDKVLATTEAIRLKTLAVRCAAPLAAPRRAAPRRAAAITITNATYAINTANTQRRRRSRPLQDSPPGRRSGRR